MPVVYNKTIKTTANEQIRISNFDTSDSLVKNGNKRLVSFAADTIVIPHLLTDVRPHLLRVNIHYQN